MQHEQSEPLPSPTLPTDRRSMLAGIGGLAAGALLVGKASAGPLDPPPGPIAPTPGPEPRIAINQTNTPGDANSLYKITQPGSYYLTGNITGVSGKHGIEIEASGVTLDLNGFDLVGIPGMGAFDGVHVNINNLVNIAVLNGSIREWGDAGISLSPSSNCRIQGVVVRGNAGIGISTNSSTVVSHCSAYLNLGGGFYIANQSTITNCAAYSNGGAGISVSVASTVADCIANNNDGNGIHATSSGCRVTSCTTHSNTDSGIVVFRGGAVTDCTASSNSFAGILAAGGSVISNCTVYNNTNGGIGTSDGCTVSDCSVYLNGEEGISCSSSNVIRNNTCSGNGIAGIRVLGNDNRVEGNNCISADYGMRVDDSGNIILRNTCSGNTTNWLLTAGNVCGPIIDRTSPGSANISGNSAPDSTGSTHPNANFSY